MRAEYIVLIATVLTLLGGLVGAIGAFWQSQARADFNRQLAAKNQEIADITNRTLVSVTGGDSFVYLEPLRRYGRVTYFLRQSGTHPTFDVVVRVQEGTGQGLLFGPASVGTIKRGSGVDWTTPLPPWPLTPVPFEPAPGIAWPFIMPWPMVFPEPPVAGTKIREFRIELAARNGIIVQQLKVWLKGDRWQTASRDIERAGVALTLPKDFNEAQDQDAAGNRVAATAPMPGAK